MSILPNSYTEYPRRRHGYDPDLYDWSNIHERAPLHWPDGKRVAVWLCVSLEWFPILPGGPFKAPGHMQTAYPDFRHYTAREYGTRIGMYRLLDTCAKAGVKMSVATNAAIAERYPEASMETYRSEGELFLRTLEALLEGRDYLLAAHPTLADVALMPFVRQFAHVDREWFGQAPYPRLQRWLQGFIDSDLFTSIMKK